VVIHRSVFEELGARADDRFPSPRSGALISEDLSFCLRCITTGIPVHLHTGVTTTHAKLTYIGESDYVRPSMAVAS
jgi:hypothetical protein